MIDARDRPVEINADVECQLSDSDLINPAMLEAGLLELAEYNSEYDDPKDSVRNIYLVMRAAQKQLSRHA